MKNLNSILKSEKLTPKELASCLLQDIYEANYHKKGILSSEDKKALLARIKDFDSKSDCDEYNGYLKEAQAVYFINQYIALYTSEIERYKDNLILLVILLATENVVNILKVESKYINSVEDNSETFKSILKKYVHRLHLVYSILLAYKKILDEKSKLLKVDFTNELLKAIEIIKDFENEHNERIKEIKLPGEFLVDLKSVEYSKEVYESTVTELSEVDLLKTA